MLLPRKRADSIERKLGILIDKDIGKGTHLITLRTARRIKNTQTVITRFARAPQAKGGVLKHPYIPMGHIAQIVRKIRHDSPATQLYIQSMLPINNSFGQYRKLAGKEPQIVEINQRLEQLAAAEQCTYIDLYSHLTAPGSNDLDPAYTNDGLHLLGDAYLVWKEVLQPYLK